MQRFHGLYIGIGLVLFLGLNFMIVSCSETEETAVESNFTSLYSEVFVGCAESTCHINGTAVFNTIVDLDMSGGQAMAYEELVANDLDYIQSPDCDGVSIVEPGDYDSSLIKALVGTDAERAEFEQDFPDCAPTRFSNMPYNISAAEKSAIIAWINSGGLND